MTHHDTVFAYRNGTLRRAASIPYARLHGAGVGAYRESARLATANKAKARSNGLNIAAGVVVDLALDGTVGSNDADALPNRARSNYPSLNSSVIDGDRDGSRSAAADYAEARRDLRQGAPGVAILFAHDVSVRVNLANALARRASASNTPLHGNGVGMNRYVGGGACANEAEAC